MPASRGRSIVVREIATPKPTPATAIQSSFAAQSASEAWNRNAATPAPTVPQATIRGPRADLNITTPAIAMASADHALRGWRIGPDPMVSQSQAASVMHRAVADPGPRRAMRTATATISKARRTRCVEVIRRIVPALARSAWSTPPRSCQTIGLGIAGARSLGSMVTNGGIASLLRELARLSVLAEGKRQQLSSASIRGSRPSCRWCHRTGLRDVTGGTHGGPWCRSEYRSEDRRDRELGLDREAR